MPVTMSTIEQFLRFVAAPGVRLAAVAEPLVRWFWGKHAVHQSPNVLKLSTAPLRAQPRQ